MPERLIAGSSEKKAQPVQEGGAIGEIPGFRIHAPIFGGRKNPLGKGFLWKNAGGRQLSVTAKKKREAGVGGSGNGFFPASGFRPGKRASCLPASCSLLPAPCFRCSAMLRQTREFEGG